MKTLIEYFNEINPAKSEMIPSNMESDEMKPLKIVAPLNDIDEALWNSKEDRWSRNAKHQISTDDIDTRHIWEKGDFAVYEGQEVEILVSKGPNFTVGISFNGRTKMVKESKLKPLTEGVMGGLLALNPLNRMMQLAGLSNGNSEPVKEESELSPTSLDNVISEDDTTNMFTQLFKANLNGEYRNNPPAARLATVGEILAGLSSVVGELTGKVDPNLLAKITSAIGLGPALMQQAKAMTQDSGKQTPTTAPTIA